MTDYISSFHVMFEHIIECIDKIGMDPQVEGMHLLCFYTGDSDGI